MIKYLMLFIMMSGVVLSAPIPQKIGQFQAMDKVTGRTKTFTINVGEDYTFNKIKIHLKSCYANPPEETPENAAFLIVSHQEKELFNGWMFSSSPALSAMEDPVYDIWVLKCEGQVEFPTKPQTTEQIISDIMSDFNVENVTPQPTEVTLDEVAQIGD